MSPDVQALRRLDTLLDDVEREGRRTDRVLRRLPDTVFEFTPSPGLSTASEIVDHIAAVYFYIGRTYSDGRWDTLRFDVDKKPVAIGVGLEALTIARSRAVESAKACSPALMRSYVAPFGYRAPAITFLRRAVDHEIHHRSEICLYAALFGISVGDIYECERTAIC